MRTGGMPMVRQSRLGLSGRVAAFVRFALAATVLVLAGCATQERAPERVPVSENTWWQVDSDIAAASSKARHVAGSYADGEMERWRGRVYDRTEEDFIPWFSGYWTQQWLALKVAWDRVGGEGLDSATRRLARYLQEQYRARVLVPVAEEVNPNVVRVEATRRYVESLGQGLRDLPHRYGVPRDQFDAHLAEIPAITLRGYKDNGERSASLLTLVRADPVSKLPAFTALHASIEKAAGGDGAVPPEARISPVAKRTSERLVARIAASGGARAAAAAVGGVAGLIISLGTLGASAIAHASDTPEMEAQLRESFDMAADEMWRVLTEDPLVGVLAGVVQISGQLEERVATTIAQPVEQGPPIGENFLVDEPIVEDDGGLDDHYDHEALERFGTLGE